MLRSLQHIVWPDQSALNNDLRTWDDVHSKAARGASPRAVVALEDATHTSTAALRPGTAEVKKEDQPVRVLLQ